MKSEETRVQFRHEGHGKPVTRRQFLSRGLIAGAATVCMPSLAQLLASKQAAAQTLDCGAAVGAGREQTLVGPLR